ncbi:MAG: LON peptidase substrate-binding domain-containing protein [Gammaproteobacteria bacterium]|nr:LON peptidase substrate-binding domain-containing protein [Gammaproteobacteria bacterium]MDH3388082.1 LON peptidase substrate-binding domain-containing protein [Gammaproteobacteria bacterium]
MSEIPLFPLKSVLLPGNTLVLKIFEPRYLDMIANCMREDSGFGVVLIHRGEETTGDTDIYSIGTTATISDWEHRADGLLGITAVGTRRFEILSTRTQQDGLTFAEVKLLEESHTVEIPQQFHYMLQLLDHISAQAGRIRNPDQPFSEILYQLIYLLPLETDLKQRLLEIPECNDRAIILHAELIRLGVIQYVKPDQAG